MDRSWGRRCGLRRRGSGVRLAWMIPVLLVLVPLAGRALPAALAAGYDWLEFDGNAQHSGDDTQETALTLQNVASLQPLFTVPLPNTADSSPVYLGGVSTAQGTRDLVFLTTMDGHILALDAHGGATVWSHQYGPNGCSNQDGACFTTSSPALDPNRQYVYSYGLDGHVHKYQVGSGAEVTGGGWPELTTLKGTVEKESPALSIATAAGGATYLYVANGGYPGDFGDYQGHVTAINLADGSQKVFNAVCSDLTVHFVLSGTTTGAGQNDCGAGQTAIWARAGVIYDPDTNRIYMATGNGPYDPSSFDWGDSVFALNPDGTGDGTGRPLDSYTPADYQQLQGSDADLGSTAPALLPAPAGSTVQHLAVMSGKDSLLRLLNLDNLSGQGGPGHTGGEVGSAIAVPQGGEVLTQPAVWASGGTTWVFVATGNGISGLTLGLNSNHVAMLTKVWQDGSGGTSPLVANGILFYVGGDGNIRALDPTTGVQKWSAAAGPIHWESPAVANGVLYITDGSARLHAFAPAPSATGTASATPATLTPTPTRTATATATPVPPTASGTPAGGTGFATGFESGQPQPSWSDTVDDGGYPAGGIANVAGICCGLAGPEAGVRQETAHTGGAALMYSGGDTSAATSYAYLKVIDLSGRPLAVGPGTTLSYWVYPQSGATSPAPVSGGNSSCVAIDLIFADGTNLRDSGAVDQSGNRLHPAAQCGHLALDSWDHVTSDIGAVAAGKTVVRIDVGYDQPAGTGGYRGYIDDLSLAAAPVSPTGTPTATSTPVGGPGLATGTPATSGNPPVGGIVNGGFEGGLSGWNAISSGTNEVNPAVSASQRHSGAYAALVGGSGSPEPKGDACIYQNFTSAGGTLSAYYLPFSTDIVNYDWQEGAIRAAGTTGCGDNGGLFRVASNARAWTHVTATVAAGSHQIYFNVHEDGLGDDTYMYVDDVASP